MSAKRGKTTPASTPGSFAPHERSESELELEDPVAGSAPDTARLQAISRLKETKRAHRGHDFYPKAQMPTWPKLYETDGSGLADKPFVAHYFAGSCDWYIAEFDPETGEAFGWAELFPGGGEYGYIDLRELEATSVPIALDRATFYHVVERDLDFEPGTLARDVIPKYRET